MLLFPPDMQKKETKPDTVRMSRNELLSLFKRLYQDNALGCMTNEQFRLLSDGYNTEQKEPDEALPLKEERLMDEIVCRQCICFH